VRRDLNKALLLLYHQSWFIFAESGFISSGPGLKCPKSKGKITLSGFLFDFSLFKTSCTFNFFSGYDSRPQGRLSGRILAAQEHQNRLSLQLL
jgi:hypothetical protein